ncbi:hypothetical protein QBC35DRAFT_395228 [Podospora australis]|uniref:ubiquitinyl hydrolase 1 n=1 Tax=Podospora australis TaxID=1536484 RepID=A0AAN6WJ58_9PEZI|nr:hypothetical protein QBC35DRAFT_395228 [Podospora australis]
MRSLEYAIHHVFLPPKIPQEDDTSIEHEHNLISSLLESTRKFPQQRPAAEGSQRLRLVIRMLERLLKVKPGLDSSTKGAVMQQVIRELEDGECVLLHIRAQNAGLLLTGRQDDILVEAFELLAPNKDVMSCQGRLIREFPDCAAAIDRTLVHNSDFLGEFVNVLCQLELRPSPVARPKSWKAGQDFDEERDTDSPFLVTDMVIGTLAGLGVSVEPQRIIKRSREQVNWDSACLPFHRSPTWLLLRVALRLVLDRNPPQDAYDSLYKALTTLHHGRLLEQAGQLEFNSDLRFAMQAKLVRRIIKLDPLKNSTWLSKTKDILKANHDELEQRWQGAQKRRITCQASHLERLCFQADSNLQLQELKKHLSWIQARSTNTLPKLQTWKCFFSNWNRGLSGIYPLGAAYSGNPEALSLMCLNIMDLWVAMDKVAGKAISLLLDYDPGFTSDFLCPLILSTQSQMARLHAIEFYLSRRRRAANNGYPRAFAEFGGQESFAVRYFDSSVEHQNLLDRILTESASTAALKLQEYHDMCSKDAELSRQLSLSTHDEEWNDDQLRLICNSWCEACSLGRRKSALRIDIFEWPLPEDLTLSKAIVFEIRPPKIVAVWRDMTTKLFLDVFPSPGMPKSESKIWRAAVHSGLKPFAIGMSRVQLASTTKPVEVTHYRGKHINQVSESAVCACLEAGPSRSDGLVVREAHADTLNDEFVGRAVAALDEALARFRDNWQNEIAVGILACLATRILSLTTSRVLSDSLLGFLSQVRNVAIQWARQLLERTASCSSAQGQKELDERVLMAALTCISTFNIESDLLRNVLRSPDDLAVLVEAAIIAQDHTPATARVSSPILLVLSRRWRATMHKSLGFVKEEVVEQNNSGFHAAIQRFWADYLPHATQWSALLGNQGHVLNARMSRKSSEPIGITFNLLDGRLLVDGFPLSRLPKEYESHPTYAQLFGTQILEVMPSTRHGMRFSACREQRGWVVHFAMIGSELVIQALRRREVISVEEASDLEVCEFVPSWKLGGDVPVSFKRNHSHWLNVSTGAIEFRPVGNPWAASSDSWILARDGHRNVLSRDGCYLIDPHSPTAEALSTILNPIEQKGNVDIVFHPDDRMVVLDLPRFSLSFMLVEGDSSIKSKHYSGMRIDECQSIGTLVGLQNQLVLRQDGVLKYSTPTRIILVPRGPLSTRMESGHISVGVSILSSQLNVKHDTFTIDSKLGRMTSNGLLSSKLYLCLLHALTSYSLPDPLTGRTGTEEALRILRSASVRSFQRLDTESYSLLCEIARLSPKRFFYPQHLQDMEQVVWSNKLPVLSQHDGFWPAVESIIQHARACKLLNQNDGGDTNSSDLAFTDQSSNLLVGRAKIRNAMFQVSEFGAEDHTTDFDRRYFGRHWDKHGRFSEKFTRAKAVTKCVVSGCQQLVDRPSAQLRGAILSITGKKFAGHLVVDITFKIDHLQLHSASLGGLWCGLHQSLAEQTNKYKTAFFLSALIHAKEASWDAVQALMAIANVPWFHTTITPPTEENFDFDYKISSMRHIVDKLVERHLYPLAQCPEATLPRLYQESENAASRRRHRRWKVRSDELASNLASRLEEQWLQQPRRWAVSEPRGNPYSSYMDVNAIMRDVSDALELARRTQLFEEYLDEVVKELSQISLLSDEETAKDVSTLSPPAAPRERELRSSQLGFVRTSALFSRPAPSTERPQPTNFSHLCDHVMQTAGDGGPLADLLDRLSRLCGNKPYQVAYINELRGSSGSAADLRHQLNHGFAELESIFEECLLRCKQTTEEIRSNIDEALRGQSTADVVAQAARLYPRISPVFLLQRLARAFWDELSMDWRVCLVNYGLSLVYLQRAERLVRASRRRDRQTDLLKELLNMGSHGCNEGDPLTFPESLVLELEQGILIRPVQQEIAAKMRSPPEGKNSVMQLNMGEGKSSVIVPIVAAALADGKRLVRVVVAKPQSNQMMHTLIATLGGLINRQIFYLPIARAVSLTASDVQVVQWMLDKCKKEGGVLLVQPEHLLSFKLMGLEKIWTGDTLGKQTLSAYREFEDASRDIVDESDENFSVKFELIYTMGSQQPIDMSPDRWTIIQELMDTVLEVARELVTGPKAGTMKGLLFEEDRASGRFPTVRVLEEAAGKRLVHAIAEHVCRTGMRMFPIQHQSKQMRRAVLEYILEPSLVSEQVVAVENASSGFFSEPTTRNALLLLRGLLATGVLLFVLGQKRFRVNYGLAPDRKPPTILAVPYRAKDSPAPRSEFSHPDVVILLTCLSYYYRGLSDDEMYTCLEKLNRSDQAEQEYNRWATASPQLHSSLRHFSGVNLEDSGLCKRTVFPALRYAKPAVDFYLATVVFPKEMREFPLKLSASGWDLGKATPHALTGFSGTTDSKYVLPLSVTALDLPKQRHTNSAVLACLLRDENTVLELGGGQTHLSALTVEMLLTAVTTSAQPMRVILDVGAQIIELNNLQVAQRWLDLVPSQEADAVIFFNDQDELSAKLTRSSPCMRMRKLGNGQSVTFCVSPEMQKRIRMLGRVEDSRSLAVTDILVYAIAETWDDAYRSLPLWATQGIRHQHQEIVWDRVDKTGELSVKDVQDYLEDEAQSLEQRYLPVSGASGASNPQSLTSKLNAALKLESRQDQVAQISDKCNEFGLANLDAMGSLQEEQERELAPEVERERQVERPPPQDPASHNLHADVKKFAVSGILTRNSKAFLQAFQTLVDTSASKLFPVAKFPSDLLATADFARTIKTKNNDHSFCSDAYQRPVQWLLTQSSPEARNEMHIVLVSAWEANKLKALLETSPPPTHPVLLRAYLPRSSLSYPSLEDLTTYTVPASTATTPPAAPPPELITQLNLFAGQLYLRSYDEYVQLCRYLGLSYTENDGDRDIAADGFVGKAGGGAGYEQACAFEASPVAFLSVLFKRIRRDCLDIEKTHMGRVLTGEILRERNFGFEVEGIGSGVGGG